MQHVAVLSTILANLIAVGAIAATMAARKRLAADRFSSHFVLFQILVFLAGLAELVRAYFRANLDLGGPTASFVFHLAIAVPTLLGSLFLIRAIEEILRRRLRWIAALYLGTASMLVVLSLLRAVHPGFDETLRGPTWALQAAVLLLLLLLGGMLISASVGERSRRGRALRFSGLWIGFKILTDFVIATLLSRAVLSLPLALTLQAASEALASGVVIFGIGILAAAVAGETRSRSVTGLDPDYLEEYGISPRETEIVALVVKGLANQEIADHLCIAPATVKDHIYRIYRKTGVKNRVQLGNLFRTAS